MKKISVISIILVLALILGSFSVSAEPLDADSVLSTARNTLSFTVLSSEDISSVTENLYLPSVWGGADVYWTSNNETLLRIDGQTGIVSRPPFGDGRACVVLSAHIMYGGKSVTKSFLVRINESYIGRNVSSALAKVRDDFDKSFMSMQNLLAIREDLKFPEINVNGITITYVSENPDILTSDGKITRDMSKNKIANFAVNFVYGYEITRLTYSMVIKSVTADEVDDMLRDDMDWIISELSTKHKLQKITENLVFPTETPNKSDVAYISSNTNVLKNDGTISPNSVDNNVTVTIRLTKRGQELTDTVSVKILAENKLVPSGGSMGGSGGSGGSESGSQLINEGSGEVIKEFDQLSTNKGTFLDVSKSHWAYEAVEGLNNNRIISGDGNGFFRPDDTLTREELVKMVVLASDAFLTDAECAFTDIPVNDWSYGYVASAFSHGIVNGRNDGTFGRGEKVTRQDAAVIIYNALKLMSVKTQPGDIGFADEGTISEYAKTPISCLKNIGLVNGKGNNEFKPLDNLTRAEGAAMIWRMIQK